MAQQALSTIVYDEQFTTPKGSVRLLLDIGKFQKNLEDFQRQLLHARAIPFDTANIPPTDPAYLAVQPYFEHVSGQQQAEMVLGMVSGHYQSMQQDASRDATILAMIANKDSAMDFEPEPYAEEDDEAVPGMVQIPSLPRNLNWPAERRLKQFLDLINSDPEVALKFNQNFQMAIIKFSAEVEKIRAEQFRPTAVGGAISKRAKPARVEPSA